MRRLNKIITVGMLLAAGLVTNVRSADPNLFNVYNYDTFNNMPGRLYTPSTTAGQTYPLVIFYAGLGGSGNNNTSQVTDGGNIDNLLTSAQGNLSGQTQKFFLLAPQSFSGDWKDQSKMARSMALASGVIRDYPIDTSRIYVTGLSAGGGGTYLTASMYPSIIGAAVPLSSWGDITSSGSGFSPGAPAILATIPIWAYHARNDNNAQTPVSSARTTVNIIRAADGNLPALYPDVNQALTPAYPDALYYGYYNVTPYTNSSSTPEYHASFYSLAGHNLRYSEFTTGDHSSATWGAAYGEAPMYAWMLSKTRNLQRAQPNDLFLFDFGTTAMTGTDSLGRTWNSVTVVPAANQLSIAPATPFAVTSTGATRAVSLTISKPFNSADANGITTGSIYPANVAIDNWGGGTFSNNADSSDNHPGEVLLGGLTPGANYKVTLFGSCPTNTWYYGITTYVINGTSIDLTTINNTSATAVFNSVTADTKGNIRVTIKVKKDGSSAVLGVINAMEVLALGGSGDTTAPAVAITSPTTASTFNTTNSTINLGGTASDNVGVTSVTWTNAATGGSGTASGTTSWNANGIALQGGSNLITVTARDAANNATSSTLTVTYTPPDTTAPTLSITSPTTASTYTAPGSTVNLSGTASDNVGVTTVTWSNAATGSNGTASGTNSWTVSNVALQSGSNVITVTAKDAANNSTVKTLTVTYTPADTTPPTVAITLPTTSSTYTAPGSTVNLSGTAGDNIGVASVTWTNAATGGSGTASGTTNWTINGITLQGGSNLITVTAKDAANNSTSATLTVTYTPPDSTPPTVTISAPTDNSTVTTSSVTVSGSATDNVGVTSVTWNNTTAGTNGTATGTTSWSASVPLVSGANTITVTSHDAANNNSTTATVHVTYNTGGGGGTPAGWTLLNVGGASVGAASLNSGTGIYTLTGASNGDIWGGSDSFQFLYQTIGNGTIVAKVNSIDASTNEFAKIGVMMRVSTAGTSTFAMESYSPHNTSTGLIYRTTGSATGGGAGGYTTTPWVKLDRGGNTTTPTSTVFGYASADGTNWTSHGSMDLGTTGSVFVGLAFCSNSTIAGTGATIGSVSIASPLGIAAVGTVTGGNVTASGSSYTLSVGSSGDIWGSSDNFEFLYESLAGNGAITARFASSTNATQYGKSGLMMRLGTTNNAVHILLTYCSINDQTAILYRPSATSPNNNTTGGGGGAFGIATPYLKLERSSGTTYKCYISSNSSTWTQVGSTLSIPELTGAINVGLIECSNNGTTGGSTTFDNVVLP